MGILMHRLRLRETLARKIIGLRIRFVSAAYARFLILFQVVCRPAFLKHAGKRRVDLSAASSWIPGSKCE